MEKMERDSNLFPSVFSLLFINRMMDTTRPSIPVKNVKRKAPSIPFNTIFV
jgi:hypothetical protein